MYYLLRFGDKVKEVPFRMVEKYQYHYSMESMRYPSELGMSVPFRMSAHEHELNRPLTREQLISWVEKRPTFTGLIFAAHNGNAEAKRMLKEWDEIKRVEL